MIGHTGVKTLYYTSKGWHYLEGSILSEIDLIGEILGGLREID